jgi:hypothetical protein
VTFRSVVLEGLYQCVGLARFPFGAQTSTKREVPKVRYGDTVPAATLTSKAESIYAASRRKMSGMLRPDRSPPEAALAAWIVACAVATSDWSKELRSGAM